MAAAEIVEVLGRLPYASNATLLARLEGGDLVVYKPDRGERPLWDFPLGTLAAREVLTYEVAGAMGLDIIPETRIVDGPYGRGSAQRFVDEDEEADPRRLLAGDPAAELWPFAVLDVVVNNADRKLGHLLVERGTGKVWGIDNGLTFHPEDKLRTILWGFAGCPIPSDLLEALHALSRALRSGLEHRVTDLLDRPSARALHRRVDALLATAVHPEPPVHRPAVPWPMW